MNMTDWLWADLIRSQAVNMIKDRECGKFNPILVECFLEISDEIKARLQ